MRFSPGNNVTNFTPHSGFDQIYETIGEDILHNQIDVNNSQDPIKSSNCCEENSYFDGMFLKERFARKIYRVSLTKKIVHFYPISRVKRITR